MAGKMRKIYCIVDCKHFSTCKTINAIVSTPPKDREDLKLIKEDKDTCKRYKSRVYES